MQRMQDWVKIPAFHCGFCDCSRSGLFPLISKMMPINKARPRQTAALMGPFGIASNT